MIQIPVQNAGKLKITQVFEIQTQRTAVESHLGGDTNDLGKRSPIK